jgi:hypothetical protein
VGFLNCDQAVFKSIFRTGGNLMDLSIVADWLTVLFLLWYGLKQFVPALGKGSFPYIGGVIALAAALFTALST